jgi:hypothetical protein
LTFFTDKELRFYVLHCSLIKDCFVNNINNRLSLISIDFRADRLSLISFGQSLIGSSSGSTRWLCFICSSSSSCMIKEVLDPEVLAFLHYDPVVADLKTLVLDLFEKFIHDLLFQLLNVSLLLSTSSGSSSSFGLVGLYCTKA